MHGRVEAFKLDRMGDISICQVSHPLAVRHDSVSPLVANASDPTQAGWHINMGYTH